MTAIPHDASAPAKVREYSPAVQRVVQTLYAVHHGFQRGHIKAKPYIRLDPEATEIEMQSIATDVENALKAFTEEHNNASR